MTSEGARELIVIGGGPAGYTAALYAAARTCARSSSRASSGVVS